MEQTRIVIVDDIGETREYLRRWIEFEQDIEVVGMVGSGEEAIELVKELKPDVVLMDFSLPGLDGIETTKAILEETPWVQIIMVSVEEDVEILKRAMLAGVRAFIPKWKIGSASL